MNILQLMSKELNLDEEFVLKISKKNNAYKKYRIPKKKGGFREIYHPSKKLKLLQYWLIKRVFSNIPISEYSTAYSKGNSIKYNALIHKNSNYILHLDISNFFESITEYHIDKLFNKTNIINCEDIDLIKNIILYKGKYLVVGSAASPIVSNCVMHDIDVEIVDKCIRESGLIYTRYADDMVISGKEYIQEDIIEKIKSILEKNHFIINERKTYFMNRKGKRFITGVVIDNNNNCLSIGSERYREVKRMIYKFLVKNEGSKDKIIGYLSYIKDIDKSKYSSIKETYRKYDKNNILF